MICFLRRNADSSVASQSFRADGRWRLLRLFCILPRKLQRWIFFHDSSINPLFSLNGNLEKKLDTVCWKLFVSMPLKNLATPKKQYLHVSSTSNSFIALHSDHIYTVPKSSYGWIVWKQITITSV